MRKILLIIACCCCISILQGQKVKIYNESLVDNAPDIFYIGIDNTIRVDEKKLQPTPNYSLTLTGVKSTMMVAGNHRYIVRVDNVVDSCLLVVYRNGKEVLRKKYSTAIIPDGHWSIGDSIDSSMSKEKILADPTLYYIWPGSYLNREIPIISFNASFSNDTTNTKSADNRFSKEQLDMIRKLNPGDIIFFENIYMIGPNGRRQKLPSFWVTIK